jgi:serine/threonine protein kinase
MEYSVKNGHLPTGTILQNGKYKIKNILGQGGFGITYLAEHYEFGEVAIKELFLNSGSIHCSRENTSRLNVVAHFEEEDFLKFKKRFKEEAKTLFSLNDIPRIVKVIEIFEENDTVYFSMYYIKGEKLDDYVKNRGGRLSETETLRIVKSLCETLTEVHQHNVLHRDIKPANIIINPKGQPFLIDFGISRLQTDDLTHTTIHTRYFAPPEQTSAKSRMGTYSDVYSLAGTAYYMLTGVFPQELQDRFIHGFDSLRILIPTISLSTDKAITAALEIKTDERTQTMADFMKNLPAEIQPSSQPSSGPTNTIKTFIPDETKVKTNNSSDDKTEFDNRHIPKAPTKDAEATVLINTPKPIVSPQKPRVFEEKKPFPMRLVALASIALLGISMLSYFAFNTETTKTMASKMPIPVVTTQTTSPSEPAPVIDTIIEIHNSGASIPTTSTVEIPTNNLSKEEEIKKKREEERKRREEEWRIKERERQNRFSNTPTENQVNTPNPVTQTPPLVSEPIAKTNNADEVMKEETRAKRKKYIKGNYQQSDQKLSKIVLYKDNTCEWNGKEGTWKIKNIDEVDIISLQITTEEKTVSFKVKSIDIPQEIQLIQLNGNGGQTKITYVRN